MRKTRTRRSWSWSTWAIMLSACLVVAMLAPVTAAAQEDSDDTGTGEADPTDPDNYEATRLTEPNSEGELDQVGELHGLSIADDGRVFYIGRGGGVEPVTDWSDPDVGLGPGTVHVWDPDTEEVTLTGTLEVFGNRGGDGVDRSEEGLVGIALDPDFLDNGWLYLHYTPHDKIDADAREAIRQVSRFTLDHETNTLDLDSEEVLLEWEVQIERCCHAGGDLKFDSQGNLYVATGDTNSSEFSDGYAGNHPGFIGEEDIGGPHADARRTSGNTNDLNGKILRITPTEDGGYTIPEGNLFPPDEYEGEPTLPEIYVMGTRNPSRMAIDLQTDYLYSGVVGPDAGEPSSTWGPAKYDWFAIHTQAGNQGWPFCVGDGQPYRDRDEDGNALDWYDCENLVNDSPNNTGLTELPPQDHHALWYSPQGGGPVFDRDEDGIPTYDLDDQTLTQPFLNDGGGQAAMGGPIYRYDPDNDSDTAWPEFWDGMWFVGDFYADRVRNAVPADPEVFGGEGEIDSIDLREIIPAGEGNIQNLHGWDFGPDGALYVLDYGAGAWFNVSENTALWRIDYVGDDPGNGDEQCPDAGLPEDRISIQLYTFNDQVDFGDLDELEDVIASLGETGYRTVEPYGQPYDDLLPAEDFRDLMAEHGIRAASSHGDQTLETFEDTVAYAATLGQDYIGGGGPPASFDTYEETIELAELLDTLGEIAVDGGVEGGIIVHNHQEEFRTTHEDPDTGEELSAWEILVEHTDPDYVSFQVDTLWTENGGFSVVELLEEHGERISMLHVKDGTDLDEDTATMAQLGEGDLDFTAIFEAAWDHVDYYMYEYDNAPEPFDMAAEAFEFMSCIELDVHDPDPECGEPVIETGYTALWDGESLDGWSMAGPGTFDVVADDDRDGTCALESVGGMGLLWHTDERGSYRLRADFKVFDEMDNSGIFVGFPDPGDDPWVAVEEGYEVQIDEYGAGDPPGQEIHLTGAIYSFQAPTAFPTVIGEWNTYEIEVEDPFIRVWINGELVNEFEDPDGSGRDLSSGHLGLQNHGDADRVQFRDIQVTELDDDRPDPAEACADYQGGATFPDAPGSGHRYFIDCLAELGIVQGHTDGNYRPAAAVSRGQLASFVVRMIESVTDVTLEPDGEPFPDVSPTSTHGEAIYKLRNAGIIDGYEDGTFRPATSVSREQTSKYIVRAIELLIEDELVRTGVSFPDVADGSHFATYIDALVTALVVQGYPDGTFAPTDPVTRGQMAKFIGNAVGVLVQEGVGEV